jgi:hypothetical protein
MVRSIVDVFERFDAILSVPPFDYVATKEPFGFDRQPQQRLDKTYCLQSGEPRELGGLLGYAQTELVPVTISLARLVRRDAVAVYRTMLTDVSSLCAALARDGVLGDYSADVETWRLPEPADEADFVIAEIVAVADYERSL